MRSASVPPKTGRNQTSPPKNPVSVPVCCVGNFRTSCRVARQRGEGRVVGKALEQLADVGDPERPLEADANVVPPLRKAQMVLLIPEVSSCRAVFIALWETLIKSSFERDGL